MNTGTSACTPCNTGFYCDSTGFPWPYLLIWGNLLIICRDVCLPANLFMIFVIPNRWLQKICQKRTCLHADPPMMITLNSCVRHYAPCGFLSKDCVLTLCGRICNVSFGDRGDGGSSMCTVPSRILLCGQRLALWVWELGGWNVADNERAVCLLQWNRFW